MQDIMCKCEIGNDLMKIIKVLEKNFVSTDKNRDYLCSMMYDSKIKTFYGTDGKKAFKYRIEQGIGIDIPERKYKASIFENNIILESEIQGFPPVDRIIPPIEDCTEFSSISFEKVNGKRISKDMKTYEISNFFKDLQFIVNYEWITKLPDSLAYKAFSKKNSLLVLLSDNRYGRLEIVMMPISIK